MSTENTKLMLLLVPNQLALQYDTYFAAFDTNYAIEISGRIIEKADRDGFRASRNPCSFCFWINVKNVSVTGENWLLSEMKTTIWYVI